MRNCVNAANSLATSGTLLVAGASGFIGTNFLQRVAQQPGISVIAVYRTRKPIIQGSNIRFVQADLGDREQCWNVMKDVDQVFMFAGKLSTAVVLKNNPLGPVTENTAINLNMLEAAYLAGVKTYVWLSSSTGYPQSSSPLVEDMFFEENPPAPYEPVGWMSRYVEKIGALYSLHSKGRFTVISLRPTGIYGPYDDFEFDTCHALPALMRRILERQDPIEIWGSGKDERDYIFVDDVVDACLMAANTITDSVALNIGSGTTYSLNQLLELMLTSEVYGFSNMVHRGDMGLPVIRRMINCDHAKEVLNFQAKTGIEEGLHRTMDWRRRKMKSETMEQVVCV